MIRGHNLVKTDNRVDEGHGRGLHRFAVFSDPKDDQRFSSSHVSWDIIYRHNLFSCHQNQLRVVLEAHDLGIKQRYFVLLPNHRSVYHYEHASVLVNNFDDESDSSIPARKYIERFVFDHAAFGCLKDR